MRCQIFAPTQNKYSEQSFMNFQFTQFNENAPSSSLSLRFWGERGGGEGGYIRSDLVCHLIEQCISKANPFTKGNLEL